MAECLLRCSWVVHPTHGLRAGETLPMRKPATGEPCAGEPHARFGGRGGPTPFPTPIEFGSADDNPGVAHYYCRRHATGGPCKGSGAGTMEPDIAELRRMIEEAQRI